MFSYSVGALKMLFTFDTFCFLSTIFDAKIQNFKLQGIKMVHVACGWRHTITVTSSGSIYTYGWSKYGQLGHGDFEDHLTPCKLEALSGQIISQVTCIVYLLVSSSIIVTIIIIICLFL